MPHLNQPSGFVPTIISQALLGFFLCIFWPSLTSGVEPNTGETLWQFVVLGQLEFAADHTVEKPKLSAMAAQFASLQQQLGKELQVPPLDRQLRIYLFQSQKSFAQHLKKWIPSVTWGGVMCRRGLFLLRQERPYVFLVVSEELTGDFRHECTHVLLNLYYGELPIWLDEGLAQCYEATDGSHWNAKAFDRLRRDWLGRSPPSVASLAKLKQMSDLGPREYAGAWANVYHWLSDPDVGHPYLQRYLETLRSGNKPEPFVEKMPEFGRLENLRR